MGQDRVKLERIEAVPQTLRDIVQAKMRDAIMAGHFAPGERLVERPLCEQLGVSRTVVRETIRYLEAEGLVETIPHKGPIVASLNWSQAKQIYDIRRQLESGAVEAAAKATSPAFDAALRAAIAAGDEGDKPGWVRMNLSYLLDDAEACAIVTTIRDTAETIESHRDAYAHDAATARFRAIDATG